jgi:protein tyrosine/serine phosphatase
MRTHRHLTAALMAFGLIAALLGTMAVLRPNAVMGADDERNPLWAKPIPMDGASNLFQVSDILYRSAQPTPDGLKRVQELGVKTVINLRAFHNDVTTTQAVDLLDDELSINTWHITDADVIHVMRLLNDPAGAPYLIHCQHGADRTGLMVAMYRIIDQHWSKDAAIDELVHGGYGYHPVWTNILDYIRHVDVVALTAAIAR